MFSSPERFFRIRRRFGVIILTLIATQYAYTNTLTPASIKPRASQSLLIDIEKAGDRLVVVGERGQILLSNDNGHTWTQSQVPVNKMLNGVSFVDDSQGWAVGFDGHVLVTDDGGVTWDLQRNGLDAQAEINARSFRQAKLKVENLEQALTDTAIDAKTRLALNAQLDDAQWELESAQEKTSNPVFANPLLGVWFADAKRGWAVGAFGTLLQTVDGGTTWVDASDKLDNEMGYHLNAVTGFSDGTVIIAGEAGFMQLSRDFGNTWRIINLDYEGTLFSAHVSPSGNEIIATGLRGKTFFSNDTGESWQDITPDVGFSLFGIGFISQGQFLLVGNGGTIALTRDSGHSYSYNTLQSRAGISSAVHNDNNDFILVGQGGIRQFSLNAMSTNNTAKVGE